MLTSRVIFIVGVATIDSLKVAVIVTTLDPVTILFESVSVSVTVGAVSNTVIVAGSTAQDSSITQGLIVAGTNIASYEARTGTSGDNYWNEGTANYVAAFSDISSGTATTTTAAVTGYTTNRSGW